MKVTMSFEVDRDGNGTMEGSVLFSKRFVEILELGDEGTDDFCSQLTEDDEMGAALSEETGEAALFEAVTLPEEADEVTGFEDDEWCGYSFISTFKDFTIFEDGDESAPTLTVEGDEITFSMAMEELGLDEIAEDAESDGLDLQMMMVLFDIPEPEFVISVTLPGEVITHNADSIEGSTLTWNIDLFDEQEFGSLSATADMSSGSSGGLNTGIIIAIAVVAAIALLVMRQRVSAKKLDVSKEN